MKIEEKVLSREQMKHLQELGVARLLEATPRCQYLCCGFFRKYPSVNFECYFRKIWSFKIPFVTLHLLFE